MSTIADVVSGVSNAKAALEGIFGVTPFTGDKLSGWERGLALTAIFGGPVVKVGSKIGKVAVKYVDGAFDKIKNALNPEKVKGFFKKVFDDYIKSPMQKGYTYYKEYKKKFDEIKYSSNRELAYEGVRGADSKTFGELANDIKNNTVHMFKKMDEVIGGKGTVKDKPNTKRKPIQPREFKKRVVNEDGTITYNLVSKKNGKEYKVTYDRDGYPVFSSKHQSELPKFLYLKSDSRQFRHLTKELAQKIEEKPELGKEFTEKELKLIKRGKVPKSLTWHHHQDAGKMQLVDYYEHEVAKHTGGRSLWGGGRKGREGKTLTKIYCYFGS